MMGQIETVAGTAGKPVFGRRTYVARCCCVAGRYGSACPVLDVLPRELVVGFMAGSTVNGAVGTPLWS